MSLWNTIWLNKWNEMKYGVPVFPFTSTRTLIYPPRWDLGHGGPCTRRTRTEWELLTNWGIFNTTFSVEEFYRNCFCISRGCDRTNCTSQVLVRKFQSNSNGSQNTTSNHIEAIWYYISGLCQIVESRYECNNTRECLVIPIDIVTIAGFLQWTIVCVSPLFAGPHVRPLRIPFDLKQ